MNCKSSHKRLVRFNLKWFYIITIQIIWFVFIIQSCANSHINEIAVVNGLLSVSANETPLKVLLGDLANKIDVDFQIHGELNHAITMNFSDMSLEKGLKRILNTVNFSIVYSKSYLPGRYTNIEKIIIYSSGKGNTAAVQRISGKSDFIASRSRHDSTGELLNGVSYLNTDQPISLETYARQLNEADPEIRVDAVIDMADEYREAALVFLEKALIEDGNGDVRVVAAEAIGVLESELGINALERGLGDSDEDVREAAINALGAIGGKKVLPALQKASRDRNEDIREEAAYLIEDIWEQDNSG